MISLVGGAMVHSIWPITEHAESPRCSRALSLLQQIPRREPVSQGWLWGQTHGFDSSIKEYQQKTAWLVSMIRKENIYGRFPELYKSHRQISSAPTEAGNQRDYTHSGERRI